MSIEVKTGALVAAAEDVHCAANVGPFKIE